MNKPLTIDIVNSGERVQIHVNPCEDCETLNDYGLLLGYVLHAVAEKFKTNIDHVQQHVESGLRTLDLQRVQ